MLLIIKSSRTAYIRREAVPISANWNYSATGESAARDPQADSAPLKATVLAANFGRRATASSVNILPGKIRIINRRLIDQLLSVIFIFSAGLASGIASPAPVEVPDTMAERMKPCTVCHGLEDRIGRDAYYPRIAGKPEGYLFNQLRNFRDGRRYYRPMAHLLANVTDQYLLEMAAYFSGLKQPYPPPERMASSATETHLAQKLINQGDPARKIPPCTECHGKELMGTAPFIPGLLGLPRVYIAAQFGAWKNGGLLRGQTADCMSEIAKRLTTEETNAVATWLAAQPVPENTGPATALPVEMSIRCASIVQGGAVR